MKFLKTFFDRKRPSALVPEVMISGAAVNRVIRDAESRVENPKTPCEMSYALGVQNGIDYLLGYQPENPFAPAKNKRNR